MLPSRVRCPYKLADEDEEGSVPSKAKEKKSKLKVKRKGKDGKRKRGEKGKGKEKKKKRKGGGDDGSSSKDKKRKRSSAAASLFDDEAEESDGGGGSGGSDDDDEDVSRSRLSLRSWHFYSSVLGEGYKRWRWFHKLTESMLFRRSQSYLNITKAFQGRKVPKAPISGLEHDGLPFEAKPSRPSGG